MADIYNRTVEFGDSFAADRMTVTFANFGPGLLVQNVNAGYSQQMSRVWELGSKMTYYIVGRTAGTLSIGELAGPAGTTDAFLKIYGDVCNAASNTIGLSYKGGWCKGVSRGGYTLNNVVISQMSMRVTVENMLISQDLVGMFNWLGD